MDIAKASLTDPWTDFANIAFLTDNHWEVIPYLVKGILLGSQLVGGAPPISPVQICLMSVNLILTIW